MTSHDYKSASRPDPDRILRHSLTGLAKIGPRYAVNRFCHPQRNGLR